MKCIINNKEVNANFIEYLGYNHSVGMYCKEVLYKDQLYKVVSSTKNGLYIKYKPIILPSSNIIGQ